MNAQKSDEGIVVDPTLDRIFALSNAAADRVSPSIDIDTILAAVFAKVEAESQQQRAEPWTEAGSSSEVSTGLAGGHRLGTVRQRGGQCHPKPARGCTSWRTCPKVNARTNEPSVNVARFRTHSSNCRDTTFKGCFITKSRLRYTVHCGRLRQSRHVHLVHPQYWH